MQATQTVQPELNYGQQLPDYGQQPPGYEEQAVQPDYGASEPGMTAPEQQQMPAYGPPQSLWTGVLNGYSGTYMERMLSMKELMIAGYDARNKYQITDVNNKELATMFAMDTTTYCERNCRCGPECKPVKVKLFVSDPHRVMAGAASSESLQLNKPCTCTYLCKSRPDFEVIDKEGGGVKLGSIKVPWRCCDYTLNVHDAHDQARYTLSAKCCQPGILCPMPCGSCKRVEFKMTDSMGTEISTLEKTVPSCAKGCCGNVSSYNIQFPQSATVADKAILTLTGVAADMMFFERKDEGGGAGAGS